MKNRILVSAIAVAAICAAAFTSQAFMKTDKNQTRDGEGHVLTSLWKSYYAAEKADQPKKMSESLETIKKEAKAKRYHWDFYDAATRLVEVETSRNWKLRQQLRSQLESEINEYGEPIVTYSFRNEKGEGGLTDYVLTNKVRLQAGRNPMFYSRTSGEMNSLLNNYIKDDYEYALWSERLSWSSREKAAGALKDYLGDSYPSAAWLEFLDVRDKDWSTRKDAAEAFATKYEGKAVSLFGKSVSFEDRMMQLERDKAGENQFKALYADIKAAEKERKSYTSGVDAKIASSIKDFKYQQENLERKEVSVSFEDKDIVLTFRNLDKADLSMAPDVKDAKPLFKKYVRNPKNSFYVLDTVRIAIPKCDDGDYLVKAVNGKIQDEAVYSPKRLSIAVREDSEGWKFYVADYLSGEPCESVSLKLSLSGKAVAEAVDVKVDGFTALPGKLAKALSGERYFTLEASCKDAEGYLKKSKEQILRPQYYRNTSEVGTYCNLFTDKGAYNPGETLKFKAVLYSGDMTKSLHTFKAGEKVEAKLMNAEGKEVGSLPLSTNEYGSVAGEFAIAEGDRNGRYSLEILQNNRVLTSKSVVVDEFVLPTYDLAFESVDSLYFMGDEIEVKGKISSYSGHPIDAAELTYTVDSRGERIASGPVSQEADGSFAIRFKTKENCYWYTVTVKVKDATGETKEFSRGVYVLDYFNVGMTLENASKGEIRLLSDKYGGASILSGDKAEITFSVKNNEGKEIPVKVDYELKDSDGKVVKTGTAMSGERKSIGIPGKGIYSLTANSSVKATNGKEISAKDEITILRVDDGDSVLDAKIENFFKLVGPCADGSLKNGEEINFQMGAGDGSVWAIVDLFGDKRQPISRTIVHLDGKAGEKGSIENVSFEYKADYPDAVLLSVFYFRKGSHFTFTREFRREKEELVLPLEFSSFEDKAMPGKEYSFILKSRPGVEAVAAVFDKSSETIAPNRWHIVRLTDLGAERVNIMAQDGSVSDHPGRLYYNLGAKNGAMFKTRAAGVMVEDAAVESMAMADAAPMPQAVQEAEYDDAGAGALAEEVEVRSDFATSLAFEPFLRTDADGEAVLKFKTSDKLSTFIVQVYAHTPEMLNSVVREEMTVSVPVKVSVSEPKYLFKGDKFVLHATVSSLSETPVSGTVVLQVYPAADYKGVKPFSTVSRKVTVPAGETVPVEFDVDPKNYDKLGLKVTFADKGKTFSDAVFVSLPVYDADQTLTEAHSAVLLAGMDKDALVRRLRSEFTGTTSKGAEYKEIDIRQMLLDAIPSKVEPKGKDVLSLSETFYVRKVASKLGSIIETVMPDAELYSKIMECRNADGGFGWFQGMHSSPVITAVLLERFAKMRDAGMEVDGFDPVSTVKYLDRNQFIHGGSWPYWCGWLSAAQYAHVRSMYASVPFDVSRETASEKSEYSKNFKEFKKYIKDYLVPSEKDGRGLNGQILAKARRIKTLDNLVSRDGGLALASAWGIKFSADSKMKSSIAADVASLYEYAVEHRDGGWYYPNAVMPWRGLLESELYAHSLLCDLLSSRSLSGAEGSGAEGQRIADGIRIWIMLQKETQQWADDPAYIDAINSVMQGGEDVLSTRVILLTKTYRKPFKDIVSAGNGFTIERHFYKEVLGADSKISRVEIYPETILKVGDKVVAEYKIWNQENRSFVKLTAPREAGFRPVNQLSGYMGWWLRPVGGEYSITPQGYRNVKADCTEYYFDVYPEENTTVSEEFFITQEGSFTAPVVSIESLYAPHYRANDAFGGRKVLRN